MASFKAKLFINDEERNVLNVEQTFKQVSDITGRPEGKTYGEPLYLTLESTRDDSFFYQSMFDSTQMIRGEVVFYKRDGFSILYKLEFANAHILGLVEEFDANGSVPLQFSIKIGWAIVRIKGITYQEYWNLDDPFEEVEATVIEREEEPEIISLTYTDMEGNPINKFTEDNINVYLELKTENCIGKLVDIDLSDDGYDFKYNGVYLEDDILEDLQITADFQKIELEVFEEEENTTETEQTETEA